MSDPTPEERTRALCLSELDYDRVVAEIRAAEDAVLERLASWFEKTCPTHSHPMDERCRYAMGARSLKSTGTKR